MISEERDGKLEMLEAGQATAIVYGREVLDKIQEPNFLQIRRAIQSENKRSKSEVGLVSYRLGEHTKITNAAKQYEINLFAQANPNSLDVSFNPTIRKILTITRDFFQTKTLKDEDLPSYVDKEHIGIYGKPLSNTTKYITGFEISQTHMTYYQVFTLMFANAKIIGITDSDLIEFLKQRPAINYQKLNIQTNFEMFTLATFGAIGTLANVGIYPQLLVVDKDRQIRFHDNAIAFLRTIGDQDKKLGKCPVTGLSRNPKIDETIITEGLNKFLKIFYKVKKVNDILNKIKNAFAPKYIEF